MARWSLVADGDGTRGGQYLDEPAVDEQGTARLEEHVCTLRHVDVV